MTVMLIRKTAKDLAGAFYEEDHSERFRKMWPDVRQFIGRNWPDFVVMARTVLVDMLRRKDVSQDHKDTIFEALQEDARRSQRQTAQSSQVGKGTFLLKKDEPGRLEQAIFYKN